MNYCYCVQRTYKLIACTLKWLLWRLGPGWWPLSVDILKMALAHLDGHKTKSVCNLQLNGFKLTIPCKFVCVATVVKCDKLVITVYRLISRYSAQKQQLNTSSYKLFTFIQNTFQPEIAPQVVTELLKDGNLSANWRRCSATKIPTFEFVVTKKSFADELHLFVETDPDWLQHVGNMSTFTLFSALEFLHQ